MKRIITNLIVALALALLPGVVLAGSAYADSGCGNPSDAKSQVLNGIGQTGGKCDSTGVNNAISAVVNILSFIVGAVAIIVVILSGFKYITSGGDSGKVSNAKNTLIYALVGVAVAALAQLLVHFVLNQASTAAEPACQKDTSKLASDPTCPK